MDDQNVTEVLEALELGDANAPEDLWPLVYEELRSLARQKMAHEASEHTLQPTALVHEAYLRLLANGTAHKWENRGHFYVAAAEAMRRILIEAARRKASLKRGKGVKRVLIESEEDLQTRAPSPSSLLNLNDALEKLEQEDRDCFKLVMLRYFGGLTVQESADAMGISLRTANRLWVYARAWLMREMENE